MDKYIMVKDEEEELKVFNEKILSMINRHEFRIKNKYPKHSKMSLYFQAIHDLMEEGKLPILIYQEELRK